MASNAMTTALALPSSKTNWTAIVPARAPPPPPPVTQATMLKRTHEIQCGKCAISDYAENIGVWNDDGTLQELGLCGECEKPDIVGCCEKCDMEIVRDSDEHDNCLIGADDKFYCQHCPAAMCEMCESCYTNGGSISVLGRDISICENCDKGGDCYDGFLDEYHYNAETNDYEEKKEEATTEFARNKICDECGCKGGCELTCVYVCGEPCEICGATPEIADDWHGNSVCDECFMCCEECYNTKNPAVFEKTASDLCECEEENDETCDGCMEVFNEDDLSCLCSNEKCGLFQKNCCKDCCAKNKCEDCVEGDEALLDEFWDGGMKEMWGEELREGHPLWEPFKLYMAMKKEQDA